MTTMAKIAVITRPKLYCFAMLARALDMCRLKPLVFNDSQTFAQVSEHFASMSSDLRSLVLPEPHSSSRL